MGLSVRVGLGVRVAIVTIAASSIASRAAAQAPDGAALYKTKCQGCHVGGTATRAPATEVMREGSPEAIVDSLTGGAMRYQGLSLSGVERRAIAEFVTGKKMGGDLTGAATARCASPAPLGNLDSGPAWNGWGPTLENTHFQPARQAGISGDQVPKLKLKWAFGFPDTTSSWAQPTVVAGRVFIGSQNGTVYSLDAKTGCVVWTYTAEGGVRAAIVVGKRDGGPATYGAYFTDQKGYAHALDASTGKVLWKRLIEDHPLIRLTASPVLHEGRLYIGTSSYEESGKSPDYPCCNFRGSIVAVDAMTGKEVWKAYTITEEAKVLGKNRTGGDSLGPAGGAIWAAPTIDVKRGLIYAAVGNTYAGAESQPMTDAIVAFNLKDGSVKWAKQLYPNDIFGCRRGEPNCLTGGPDFDFGASAALTRLPDGREVLVAGQKSGMGYMLDVDKQGEVIWEYRAGRGGALGGIVWGVATDGENAYFPVADLNAPQPGGLHAVNLKSGERAWFAAPPQTPLCGTPSRACNVAQSAAITVIPGAVFSGSFDGGLRAYSTKDGSIIWEFDTNREFTTLNGVKAKGASINGPAPTVAGGMLFVGSGDYRSRSGNVLLAFGVE